MILKAVFAHVRMRVLVQSVRFHVFSIIQGLLAHHKETLKQEDVVAPYITLAEGEKDPRNLLVAFSIARTLLREFDVGSKHMEAMSNIVFCYFPITFRPPANDPYGITPDDLRLALRQCMASDPALGPYAIPIFLEKLAAGSPAIKRDTLQSMTECFTAYGASVLRQFSRKLWNSIKLEVFHPTDRTTEELALSTMQVLIVTLNSDDDDDKLAHDACEECIGILREPEKNQAKHAMKVLCAFLSTTPSVARYTLSNAIPHLLKLLSEPREATARPSTFLLLSDLIAAARDSKTSALAEYKDDVLGALISGIGTSSTTRPVLAGLTGLVSTPDLLSDQELGYVVLKANETLLKCLEEEQGDEGNAILKLLMTVASEAPLHVRDQTLPLLLAILPESVPEKEEDFWRYQTTLDALATVSGPAPIFTALVEAITPRLFAVSTTTELGAAYLHAQLHAIKRVLSENDDAFVASLVSAVFSLCLRSRHPRVVLISGEIVSLTVQRMTTEQQQEFASLLFPAFLCGKIAAVCAGEYPAPETPFFPFSTQASNDERNLYVLFEAALVPLRQQVVLDDDLNVSLETILVQGMMHASTDRQLEAVVRIVGSVLNKHADALSSFLEHKNTAFWSSQVLNTGRSVEERRDAIRVWTWICKALIVRNHALALEFVDRLFDVFSDEAIAVFAGKAIGQIAATDPVLTKKNGAVVKFLWSQKFAVGMLPRLMEGKDNAHLIALTSLVQAVPYTVYAHEMGRLLPLLLRALAISDAQIRLGVLETLLVTAQKNSLSEHAVSLTRHALESVQLAQLHPPSTRIAALRLLAVLPSTVSYDVLHPVKSEVLRALSKALDDPKRAVRRQAVDTREVWFKYTG
ncbi:unnamed protein product [Mycena citricolor]|uniref:MMS19 nucleotide excision repair protein n=1 Tax=Mycena citricolor TaxID=2018698 RepID=A0AAD2K7F3_9AGAR|nr:unnamed protein product [Mycena citricolor]